MGGKGGDRCLIWGKGDRGLWVLRVRSLFDVGNRRSRLLGDEWRSLFDEGIGDRVCWC